MKIEKDAIKDIFEKEFGEIAEKFFVIDNLTIKEITESLDQRIPLPGIYIFWSNEYGVIKVGKSQTNSRKRALQHIKDGTNILDLNMSKLTFEKTYLLLFNLKDSTSIHWLLSLEYFFEYKLEPRIHTRRNG